jgi:fibrillarin-like pre-rRNA processing protein
MEPGKDAAFDGVRAFVEGHRTLLATTNLIPGTQVLGEKLLEWQGNEYRLWSPYRSKLSAAILKGLKPLSLGKGSKVLYLGAAAGTTASYVSDMVGAWGAVFCVDFAPRPMKKLLRVCESRANMVPILADARHPETYAHLVPEADFLYQDLAQPNQGEIFCWNAKAYLCRGGSGLLMMKSRSVDVSRVPDAVFAEERQRLERTGINVDQTLDLEPFDKDHMALAVST